MSVEQGTYFAGLGHQALGRDLTAAERDFAAKLESVYVSGVHGLAEVASALAASGVARPSGETGPWTADAVLLELSRVNRSLDDAYAKVKIVSSHV